MKTLYVKTKTQSTKKMGERQNSCASTGALHEVKKNAGGRPPKYSESSRPITVTLPDRILRDLQFINNDRSRAIVKCVETVMNKGDCLNKPVELIELTPGKALILVGPSSSLMQIKWLNLVEITPLRYLLVIPLGTVVEVLEVTIRDLLKDLDPDSSEGILISELLEIIGYQRRKGSISKAEILFFDIPCGVNSRKP